MNEIKQTILELVKRDLLNQKFNKINVNNFWFFVQIFLLSLWNLFESNVKMANRKMSRLSNIEIWVHIRNNVFSNIWIEESKSYNGILNNRLNIFLPLVLKQTAIASTNYSLIIKWLYWCLFAVRIAIHFPFALAFATTSKLTRMKYNRSLNWRIL